MPTFLILYYTQFIHIKQLWEYQMPLNPHIIEIIQIIGNNNALHPNPRGELMGRVMKFDGNRMDGFKTDALDFSYQALQSEGIQLVSNALRQNTTIKSLSLANNYLKPEDATPITNALQTNTTLQELSLYGNALGDSGIQTITDALITSQTLLSLNLSCIKFKTAGCEAIAHALKHNRTLLSLGLSQNELKAPDLAVIFDALESNSTLKALHLGYNQLGDFGARKLARALETNTTLESLYLGMNGIGSEGAQVIASALSPNIKNLTLNNNLLSPQDIAHVIEALKTNYTLEYLSFARFDEPELPIVTQYLARNKACAECLRPLHEPTVITDAVFYDLLDKANDILEQLIQPEVAPELLDETSPLPETNYLAENYRLLCALSHIQGNPNTTIQYLEAPFQDPKLQSIADRALAEALTAIDAFNAASPETRDMRAKWIAYQHRDNPDSPLFKMAIYELTHPGELTTVANLDEASTVQLLPYQNLLDIAEKAYQALEDKEAPEARFLAYCLEQTAYQRTNLGKLFQSPAFLQALKEDYPEQTEFQCLESMLFFENLNKTYQMPENLHDVPPITEANGITEKYKNAVKDLANHSPQASLEEKLSEAKIAVCAFVETHNEENQESPDALRP